MSSGPSKEELQNYWNTSRRYFDELARHYQIADPEYYKEYIAPFYSNPLLAGTGSRSGSSPITVMILAVAILILGLAAGIVFFFLGTEQESKHENDTPRIEKKAEPEEKQSTSDSIKTRKTGPNRKEPLRRIR